VRRSSVILLAILAVACSSGGANKTSSNGSGAFPVTVEAANGSVTLNAKPVRIVSLSPTATEMLFAIGAGSQVVAVDDFSNFPPEAPKTTLSALEPNVEAIIAYRPDLVVFSNDIKSLGASLQKVNIPALLQPAVQDLEGSYAQINQLGTATGHRDGAGGLIERMRNDIQAAISTAPHLAKPLTYYHELETSLFTATSATFIGKVYSLLGLRNIADPADTKATGGYPQLSAEFIIQTDPDAIFLADTKYSKQSADSVKRRPGWARLAAVKEGHVFELDDDIASRWGPRIVDFLRVVSADLQGLKKAA
jgi:cobalamin transport system substrate-binding protein